MFILTFECYSLGVFIFGGLCEIFFMRVFIPCVAFVMRFES